MEKQKVTFGLANHFPRHQWLKDSLYLQTHLKEAEDNVVLHGPTVRTAFQNIIGFLKSIHDRDATECEDTYESILKDDSSNLNALVGLFECTASSGERASCKVRIKNIMTSSVHKYAVPKALLEIGLAMCTLIPRYQSEDRQLMSEQQTRCAFAFDCYENLEFQTDEAPMEDDLYTDCNIAQKKRIYSSLRYFREGLHRLADVQTHEDKSDVLIWEYFLAKTYNRLDNSISYTRGSRKFRKDFSSKALMLFCKMVNTLNQSDDRFSRMYFQRSLAYIGQILVTRKDLLMEGKADDFVPECFQSVGGYFLRGIWDNPRDAFTRAYEYGYDNVVYARYAKHLLHEGEYDSVIQIIGDMFARNDSIHWYSALIRMTAYRRRHRQRYVDAKGEFSSLTRDDLLEAEKDGKYCFDTHATSSDLSEYAITLRWLGTFPDGKQVTDKKKIRDALHVLERMYKEQGCHTDFKVHKTRAQCHADLGEFDDAIKYITWSLNSNPNTCMKPSIAFVLLIEYSLKRLEQSALMQNKQISQDILKQIKYFIEREIKRCHDFIRSAQGRVEDSLFATVKLLLDEYDKAVIDLAESKVSSESFSESQEKKFVEELKDRFATIFRNIGKWCRNHPEQMKCLLDLALDSTSCISIPTMVKMCLISLSKDHRKWTGAFYRRWNNRPKHRNVLELCDPSLEVFPNISRYDFVIIHAPEDKEWVFYTFLPEMEDRPNQFRGCVPDRDFKRGDTFEKNIVICLKKTTKVFLVITSKFFERVYGVLKKVKIIATLEKLHAKRTIDVIALFTEEIQLDKTEHSQLMTFENVDASGPYLDWNCLRIFLVQQLRPKETNRPPVIWEDGGDEAHVRPRDNDDDKYRLLEEDILPYGVPAAMYIIHRSAYIVGYDGVLKVPRWVAHKIDRKTPRGVVSRNTHHKHLRGYRQDLTVPAQARSAEKDYAGRSDITHGHLTPLADHSSTLELAKETNCLTNMVPELKNNCLWNRLEEHCRDKLTKDFDTIYVITGTLFLQYGMATNNKQDGLSGSVSESTEAVMDECTNSFKNLQMETPSSKRNRAHAGDYSTRRKFLMIEVTGPNDVAVPTHLYKVIIAKNSNEKDKDPCIGTFMVPNQPLYDAELEELSVSISKLESWLAIDLCRNMRPEMKTMSVSTLPTAFFPKGYRMRKIIGRIDTLDGLHSVWDDLSDELKKELNTVYEEKKTHLMKKS